jgi:hypothetical protein
VMGQYDENRAKSSAMQVYCQFSLAPTGAGSTRSAQNKGPSDNVG